MTAIITTKKAGRCFAESIILKNRISKKKKTVSLVHPKLTVLFLLLISGRVICQSEDIVCRSLIICRKNNYKARRNLPLPRFIGTVYPLINPQQSGNFLLHKVMILSQIAKPWIVHNITPHDKQTRIIRTCLKWRNFGSFRLVESL